MQTFFLVWNPKTGYTKHKHAHPYLAKQEAERLARQHKGDEFIVLQAISSTISSDVVTKDFKPWDEVPF